MIGVNWRRAAGVVLGTLVILLGVERALTCWGPFDQGVHFNTEVPDFGLPPQDVVLPWFRGVPMRPGSRSDSYHYREDEDRMANCDRIAGQARSAERRGDYRKAIGIYRQLIARDLGSAADWRDRVELLTEALHQGRPAQLETYVGARNVYESDKAAAVDKKRVRQRMETIASDPTAGFLRAHALYTIAALEDDAGSTPASAAAFERCAELYPTSPRAESALIMATRAWLESGSKKAAPQPRAEAEGRRLISELLARYPHTRFRGSAIGGLGRIAFLEKRYDAAIAHYRRQLALDPKDLGGYESIAMCRNAQGRADEAFSTYLRAFSHCDKAEVAWCLHREQDAMTPQQTMKLGRRLAEDPALLQPYLEFRLHLTHTSRGDLRNLVELSRKCFRRHPEAKFRAPILARLAEIGYVGRRFAVARIFAARSLRIPGDGHDLATFVHAATSNRLGRYADAAREFRRLIIRWPESSLVGGARENLALACEKIGRLGEALDQYSKLKYDWDVAYLLDVRMTPAQIEGFLRDYPTQGLRKKAVYALAMRYLRSDRFALAERRLRELSRSDRLAMAGIGRGHAEDDDFHHEQNSRLYDPLATAHALARLHRAYSKARGDEAKARAIYALASYYQHRRNLLLYNPSLWQGDRAFAYQLSWNENVASDADARAWRRHCYEHECLARTRALCLEIVHRYPRSSVAAKAAYTAGVACFRLAGLNEWWRKEDDRAHLSRQAVRLMTLVAKRYPKSIVAKAAAKYADVYSSETAEREQASLFDSDR